MDFKEFWEATKQRPEKEGLALFASLPEDERIQYKTYPRFPRIELPGAPLPRSTFASAARRRQSAREFGVSPISLTELSLLFELAVGRQGASGASRVNPSAGGLYPVETYVVALNVDGLSEGLYHYNVQDHVLEDLLPGRAREQLTDLLWDAWPLRAGAIFILTAVFNRSVAKYGSRGYRFAVIEVGHYLGSLSLSCEVQGLSACAVGGFEDDTVAGYLDIDQSDETVVCLFAVGTSASEETPGKALLDPH